MITPGHSIGFQCNLVYGQTNLFPLRKYMTGSFRFCTVLAFLKMAFCRLHDEYWAVNVESLGWDTLSNTETSKPCFISKNGLVVHTLNILLS